MPTPIEIFSPTTQLTMLTLRYRDERPGLGDRFTEDLIVARRPDEILDVIPSGEKRAPFVICAKLSTECALLGNTAIINYLDDCVPFVICVRRIDGKRGRA
jgi:hypothetical protein